MQVAKGILLIRAAQAVMYLSLGTCEVLVSGPGFAASEDSVDHQIAHGARGFCGFWTGQLKCT
jgi:hypothetical protein